MSTIQFHTITNKELKAMSNFSITYAFGNSTFGRYLLGVREGSICHISFHDSDKESEGLKILKADWPTARLTEDFKMIQPLADQIFKKKKCQRIDLLLRGTDLQCSVWKELTKLAEGSTTTYEQVAKAVGNPKAIRSVASAIAKNKIGYLIPCHRVIRKNGLTHKYRWGADRKIMMLQFEANQN